MCCPIMGLEDLLACSLVVGAACPTTLAEATNSNQCRFFFPSRTLASSLSPASYPSFVPPPPTACRDGRLPSD